jgi:hypothetical protein
MSTESFGLVCDCYDGLRRDEGVYGKKGCDTRGIRVSSETRILPQFSTSRGYCGVDRVIIEKEIQ